MLEQSLGDKLRQLIQDNRTFDNVSYYAQYFSDADYGTTHISVLAENGDAVAVTTSINFRLDFSQGFLSQNSGRDFRPERYFFKLCSVRLVVVLVQTCLMCFLTSEKSFVIHTLHGTTFVLSSVYT